MHGSSIEPAYGGIINDIGVHRSTSSSPSPAPTTRRSSPARSALRHRAAGFEDFAEIDAADADRCAATCGWTGSPPDGLPTWGDGRLFVLGTEGTLELRKNLDIAGRDGGDHMFLVDRNSTRHIPIASDMPVTYFRDFLSDIVNRTSTFRAAVACVHRLPAGAGRRRRAPTRFVAKRP